MRSEMRMIIEREIIDNALHQGISLLKTLECIVAAIRYNESEVIWKNYSNSKYYYVSDANIMVLEKRINTMQLTRYESNGITILVHATVNNTIT